MFFDHTYVDKVRTAVLNLPSRLHSNRMFLTHSPTIDIQTFPFSILPGLADSNVNVG